MNRAKYGPARRIIPCLDVRDGKVVKGIQFRNHRVMGDIVDLAKRYRDWGADELVFYDITASPEGRSVDREWVSLVAAEIDIPFCVAGGIRSVESAEAVLKAGADKISVNTPALEDPGLVSSLSEAFGMQCIVIGVDSLFIDNEYHVKQYTGDPEKMQNAGRKTMDWIHEVQERGAGEIVLNCMNQDGVKNGYDIDQLAIARELCAVPLIASGGAGAREHFLEVFERADVDGALAATVFHSGEIEVPLLKDYLADSGLHVRP